VSDVSTDVVAVIVDFHAGQALSDCVDSLHANGVGDIIVVENGEAGSTMPALSGQRVVLVEPNMNLGYGRGVNRGVAAAPRRTYLLISNPDVIVHEGAVDELVQYLDSSTRWFGVSVTTRLSQFLARGTARHTGAPLGEQSGVAAVSLAAR
jgi:GT2 family glycosyltransferase